MASKSKEQQSPVKRKFTSPVGNQKYVTKGISPRFKANLKDFRSFGPVKQNKQKGDLGPNHGKAWRKTHKSQAVKFHFGGNSADPLNLNSLIDRDPSVVTPQASPMSVHSASPVEVLEPRDKTDPLNLKRCLPEPENNVSHVTPKKRKKKKRGHNHQDRENEIGSKEQSGVISQLKKQKKILVKTDFSCDKIEDKLGKSCTEQCSVQSTQTNDLSKEEDLNPSPEKAGYITKQTAEAVDNKGANVIEVEQSPPVTKPKIAPGKSKEIGKPHASHKGKDSKKDKQSLSKRRERKEKLFIYGNYNRYYGYRNPNSSQDLRLKCFKKEWFEGKDVLDLGCNVGHVTLTIARDFNPRVILGMDIDTALIKAARNNLRYYVQNQVSVPGTSRQGTSFPVSFSVTSGPLAAPVVQGSEENLSFPHNVLFKQENYVPCSNEVLSKQKPMYDMILCLSLTKWIHLNWGDEGLKLMFKRIFLNLRPGGRLVLEPQPFSSYKKKKNLTEKIRANYDAILFRPEHFIDYLLSDMVGFATFEVLEIPQHKASGFQRPLYLLTKAADKQGEPSQEMY